MNKLIRVLEKDIKKDSKQKREEIQQQNKTLIEKDIHKLIMELNRGATLGSEIYANQLTIIQDHGKMQQDDVEQNDSKPVSPG